MPTKYEAPMVIVAATESGANVFGVDYFGQRAFLAQSPQFYKQTMVGSGFERAFETAVAGVRMRAPMMSIHTVAAGGGSILHFDGARFRVGPDAAGANPGPKCYRRGGPLAVTDANVMAGKLIPDFFPKIFGPPQNLPLDAHAVRNAFVDLAQEVGGGRTPEEIADGFIKIAVENMANAIKKISVQRGYDVTRYALNCFGGAGGQHACLVADALGMTRVYIHPLAGVLSAYGMGLAELRALREQVARSRLLWAQDRERGVAWQVPLLTLPQARFLLMSATLGDTRFFEEAITRLNGRETVTVKSVDRPVPLAYAYSEIPLAHAIAAARRA